MKRTVLGLAAAVVVAIAVVVAAVVLSTGRSSSGPASRAGTPVPVTTPASAPVPATVTMSASARAAAVPRSFLGVSTEYWTVPVWTAHMRLLTRVFGLLQANGPLVLRIGGDSADHTFWAPRQELPEWVFELTPSWLRQVSALVRRTRASLILDLNLVTATPANAAQWARTAEARLPRESIVGFEIGNEPDIYSHGSWLSATGGGRGSRALPRRITAGDYAQVYAAYAAALQKVDPGVPLLGPALAEPQSHYRWLATLVSGPHRGLTALTVHRYPYSQCARRGARTFPTIARVLSENATAGMAATIRRAERLATAGGLPLRLTEINSVTCGGRRGVSDTFATALWAPDALFELLHAGARSASVHVRANAINMAFELTPRGFIAHPLFYGMTLFSRALGADPRLVALHLAAPPRSHLKAWAVRVRGGRLNVLLIDKGSRTARVTLRLPAAGAASVERLLAPTVRSTGAVTLAGQHLDAQARWVGRRTTETVPAGPGGYEVTVGGMSAALVSLPPARR